MLRQAVKEAAQETEKGEYEAKVNQVLDDALREHNSRDAEKIQRHLDEVKDALAERGESVEVKFGGSVRKRTYVEGLSDIDALLLVNQSELAEDAPKQTIEYVAEILRSRLPRGTKIETGSLSVKATFADGTELQLLPALRTRDGYRIARPRGETWSDVVRPDEFARDLSRVNQKNGRAVVPAIKLVKAAQDKLPEDSQIKSYHVEAIAVEAFDKNPATRTRKEAVEFLLDAISRRVKTPMEETTGQTRFIDRDLGAANSDARRNVSDSYRRLRDRLKGADDSQKSEVWEDTFGTED